MAQVKSLKTGIKFKDTPIGKVPVDWAVSRLGDLCVGKPEYGANVSAIDKDENLPRYVRITDINNDGYLLNEKWKSINRYDAKAYMLKTGDLLFARSGATVGKTYLYCKEDGECAFAGYLIKFRPNAERLLPELLFQFTHSNSYYQWVKGMLRAGAQPNINGKEYSDLIIPIPPLSEQKKIAEILSNVDDAIEETDRIIDKTKELKKGLMQELLTKGIGHKKFKKTEIGEIPEEWEVRSLGDSVIELKGGASLEPGDFTNSGTKVLPKLGVVRGGVLSVPIIKQKYCSNEYARVNKKSLVNSDYIIVVLRDLVPSGPNIGLIVKIPDSEYYILAQGVYGLKVSRGKLSEDYLIQLSNSTWYRKYMQRIMIGSTQVHIRNNEFLSVIIPVPPIKEQCKIATILSETDSEIKKEQSYKSDLETLKKALMQVLLTGKIRVKVA